jgi:hypothetical protein
MGGSVRLTKDTVRWPAITTCSPRFLIIPLERPRQRVVNHNYRNMISALPDCVALQLTSDVRLVNAHTKRDLRQSQAVILETDAPTPDSPSPR